MVYISESNGGAVLGFNRKGDNTITIGGLNQPEGLFVDSAKNLWVVNTGAEDILVFAKNGTTPIKTLMDPNEKPVDVTVCPNGTVYVSNFISDSENIGSISVYDSGSTSPTRYLQDPQQNENYFITCDSNDNVFTDMFVAVGAVDEYIGGTQSGLTRLPMWLSWPGGIKLDNDGNLLIYDTGLATVTEYTEAGTATGKSMSTGYYNDWTDMAVKRDSRAVLGADANYSDVGKSELFPSGVVLHTYSMPPNSLPLGVAYDPGQKW